MIHNGAALALSIVLIAWAGSMRAVAGTWLNPAAFYALWWCFAAIIPLVLAPNEPVGANALIWIIASCIAVSIGAAAGNFGFKTRVAVAPSPATDRELFTFGSIVLVSVILGFASSIAYALGSNVALADLLDVEKLVTVSNQLYVQRYADVVPPPPILSRVLLPFVYLAPALGGILFVLRREKMWKLLALMAFLPAVFVTVLQTTKGAVLYAILFWLSGYFGARLRFGRLAVFTRGHIVVALVVGGGITIFFFAVSFARMGTTDASLIDVVVLKLFTAAFGHMNVFSKWLADYTSQPFDPGLGTTTLSGPLELLGYSHRIPGLFDDLIELVAGDTSNIYTAFRPLIQDFTIPGALAILAFLGFVGGIGFRLVAIGKWSALPLLLLVYQTTMWTPITWLWVYNSLTATLAIVAFLVFAIRVWRGPSGKRHDLSAVPTAG